MLSIKNVLPNLLKSLIVTMATSLSISAFASDAHTDAPKELSVEEVSPTAENLELTAEEAEAKAKMEEELKNAQ